jgi:hypothetical protein
MFWMTNRTFGLALAKRNVGLEVSILQFYYSTELCTQNSNFSYSTDHKTEFMFYQGPILFLLMANIIFFTMTVIKFLKLKKESAVLKRGDSMTHGGSSGGLEDKQRLFLFDSIAQTCFQTLIFLDLISM